MDCVLFWIESHPGLASWGQFFGSIIALGIAITIPWRQERVRRAEVDKKNKNLRLAIVTIARSSEEAIKRLSEVVLSVSGKENVFPDTEYRAVEAHLAALHGLDLTQFPNEHMIEPFIQLKSNLEDGLSWARSIKDRPTPIDLEQITVAGLENLGAQASLDAASREACTASRAISRASTDN